MDESEGDYALDSPNNVGADPRVTPAWAGPFTLNERPKYSIDLETMTLILIEDQEAK